MFRSLMVVVLTVSALALADRAAAQESKAAGATRKALLSKVTINSKEVGLKDFLETDLNGELDKGLRYKIDNASGVSNNMKISYTGKDVTVEKLLNDLADKYDFGYYVLSNVANNKEDGKVVIRKSSKGKERGYEAGKEPKKDPGKEQSWLAPAPRRVAEFARIPTGLAPPFVAEFARIPTGLARNSGEFRYERLA